MCEKGFEGRNGKEAGTIDIYEKRAEELMKLGDEILAERKRKSAIKRRAVFAVSGMCAALIVCVGILHNREQLDSVINPIPDKTIVSELTTETTAYTTTISPTDTAVVTVKTENTVTTVTTTQTGAVSDIESLTAEFSTVTTGSAGAQNLTTTHTENAKNTVANTKPHIVITTDSRTTTTGIVSTAAQIVTSTETTAEEGIPCTISQSTQTTTKISTTTAVVSTYELTVNTIPVLTMPTTAQVTTVIDTVVTQTRPTTAVCTIDVHTQPTTAQVTSVVAVTTIPTVLPGNTQGELNDRFEWQRRIFIKTPYYADKANATDYLGNVGDNQIYSLGYNNAYICFLMLVDDNYIICVNEEYYEYVIEKILGGIV